MICKKCGAENDNDDIFCYQCGNKLEIPNIRENTEITEKKCPKCGQMLGEDDAFCFKCGETVDSKVQESKINIAHDSSKISSPDMIQEATAKKKKQFWIAFTATLAVAIVGFVGYTIYEQLQIKKGADEILELFDEKERESIAVTESAIPPISSTKNVSATKSVTTTSKPKTTEVNKTSDVNYSLYTAAINKICLQYDGYDLSNCYYTLYDIDRDGVKELIINVADGSVEDKFMFCTIRDNEAIYVGEMYSRYVWLSEKNNELYANLGHSGYQMVQRIDFDGSGISTETISEGEIAGDYTTYGKSLETNALDDSSLLMQFYTDDDFPYVEAYVETYDYSGLDGAESRLYVDGDFAYIEVEKAIVDDDTFWTVGTYQKSECGDYIDLHFNAYAEPETTIFVTPYNKNGMAGNVKACVVPKNATNTIKTNTITVIPVDQKGQIAIYDGSKVAGFTTSYVVDGGACTKVRESLGNQWHVTAKNKCFNYGVEWYELWDTDDGDYYGWVDSNYISFY